MAKTSGFAEKTRRGRSADRRAPQYRAITEGDDRDQWAVVDGNGGVLFRGDARVAAMVASRLTRTRAAR